MRKYGIAGGSFWRWVNFSNDEDSDGTLPNAIKKRGTAWTYNSVKDVLVQQYSAP